LPSRWTCPNYAAATPLKISGNPMVSFGGFRGTPIGVAPLRGWSSWIRDGLPAQAAATAWAMVRQIVIELETPGDSRTMFRLLIDNNLIAEGLTAAQAHILVGEILERIVLPKPTE